MHMKHLSLILAASLTACGGGGGGGGSGGGGVALPLGLPSPDASISTPVAVADCSVDLNGDSLLNGTELKASGQTPAQTLKAQRPRYVITDDTVAGLTAQVDAPLFARRQRTARIVVLEHGVNDAGHGLDLETSLSAMTKQALSEGRLVVLTGLAKVDVTNQGDYRQIPVKIAAETGASYAGWDQQTISTLDGLHPDQASSDLLVGLIIKQLDTLAPECR